MDPAKLKVVELRAELLKRGLDTKGNKAVLVERLRQALEDEPEDQIVETTEKNESSSSEEETGRGSRRAKEKTPEPTKLPPRTPSRATRNAATVSAAVAPKTPTRSTIRSAAAIARQTPIKLQLSEKTKDDNSEEDEEEPPIKQSKIEEKSTTPSPVTPEKIQKQDEISPKVQQPKIPVIQTSPVKTIEKSPIKPQESPMKPQSSPVKILESPTKMQQNMAKVPDSPTKVMTQSPVKLAVSPIKAQSPAKPQITTSPVKTPTKEHEKQIKVECSPKDVSSTCIISPQKLSLQTTDVPKQILLTPPTEVSKAKDEEKSTCEVSKLPSSPLPEASKSAEATKSPMKVVEKTDALKSDEKLQEISPKKKVEDVSSKQDKEMEVEDESYMETEENNSVETNLNKQDIEEDIIKDNKKENIEKNEDNNTPIDRKRKRSLSIQEDLAPQQKPDDEPEFNTENVVLSWYDSDLNLQIDQSNFISAIPMHKDGFGLVWAGARASYGFNTGKVYYEAKIVEKCSIDIENETSPHILRVGWSVSGTSMQLGEEKLSYGYDGTGKKTTECNFIDYGVEFKEGDIVTSYLDMSDETIVKMSFAVNGENLGEAFIVNKEELGDKALFPHVLSKNCTFACNFGQEEKWSKTILDGFIPVGKVDLKDRIAGPQRPLSKEECEMIMMCGLPGSGKTFWCTKYASEHPEKMYNILGTSSLINKMKVMGLPRKDNYQGQWDTLLSMCTRALNTLLDKAYTRRRNYILDHYNVYPSGQKRKMRNFVGFSRKAVVIVPKDEEYKTRSQQRKEAEGKEVPDSTILEMKASFLAPEVGEFINSVEWPELDEKEAKKLIEQYNKEGIGAGYGPQSQQQSKRARLDTKDNRDNRIYNNRDHRRGGYQDRRNSGWRGGNNGGWRDNRSSGRGHMRHGSFAGGPGGWRPRGPPPLAYRSGGDRRGGTGGDRRQGNDRLRAPAPRQGSWGQSNYQGQQNNWNQTGSWSGSQSQGWNQSGWGGNNQQWNWQKYGQGNYGSNYNQNYDNGNYGGWNQQYYNQYWDQPQQSGQMATGSQAVSKP